MSQDHWQDQPKVRLQTMVVVKVVCAQIKTLLPCHDSLRQESKYPQGTTTAKPGSPQHDNRLKDDISTE